LIDRKAPTKKESKEKADTFRGHFHSYHKHHREYLILIAVAALSLLMNFIFITIFICRRCRESSLTEKLAQKKNMVAEALVNQASIQPSESKQRLI
jgi:uncharacterized protein YneF (UPF0154 family)